MNNLNFTIFEQEALLQFLKDYINRDNLSIYDRSIPRHLFLAFVKLQNSVDKIHEGLEYTE